jgi:hypothetical protein
MAHEPGRRNRLWGVICTGLLLAGLLLLDAACEAWGAAATSLASEGPAIAIPFYIAPLDPKVKVGVVALPRYAGQVY